MTKKLTRLRDYHSGRLNNDLITFKMYGSAYLRIDTDKEKAKTIKRLRDLRKDLIKRTERVDRLNFAIDNELVSTDFNEVDEMLFRVKHPDHVTRVIDSIFQELGI